MFDLPFGRTEFLGVFARYNDAVWPAQILLIGLALLVVALAFRRRRTADRWIAALIAILWLWTGLAYHVAFFTAINPAAWLFGALFAIEALLFVRYGVLGAALAFRPRADAYGVLGALFLLYALILYPLVGRFTGHVYPAVPTFGTPCPTVIFTFGILLLAEARVPWPLLAVPFAWGLLGSSAVLAFGIVQDTGLIVAALAGSALILRRNRASRFARTHLV